MWLALVRSSLGYFSYNYFFLGLGVFLEGDRRGYFLWTGSHLFFTLFFFVALLEIGGLVYNSELV